MFHSTMDLVSKMISLMRLWYLEVMSCTWDKNVVPGRRGRYKFLQVDCVSPNHGQQATALKGPLREVEARDLVLGIS